jgi:hypothetical protein
MRPSPTRAQAYQVNDPCYDIGRGVPPIGINVKRSYVWYLKNYTSGVIPTNVVVSIKNDVQVLTIYPNASLCINGKHTFYEN